MMPTLRLSDSVYERLQKHAVPLVDTPDSVIARLLDAYEKKQSPVPTQKSQSSETDSHINPNEDSPDSEDLQTTSKSGFWFVNVGESPSRNWDDCTEYGFLAAGWAPIYSKPLRKLRVGSKVFAYMKELGYVGYGEVVREACPVEQFTPTGHRKPLLELPLRAEEMNHSLGNASKCEWVVGVKWHKAFPREEAKTFTGIFANQHIVCRLRDQDTLAFLRQVFNVPSEE